MLGSSWRSSINHCTGSDLWPASIKLFTQRVCSGSEECRKQSGSWQAASLVCVCVYVCTCVAGTHMLEIHSHTLMSYVCYNISFWHLCSGVLLEVKTVTSVMLLSLITLLGWLWSLFKPELSHRKLCTFKLLHKICSSHMQYVYRADHSSFLDSE